MCCTYQQVTHHLSLLLVSVACCCIFKWCHQYPIFLAQNAHHFYIVPEPPLTIRFGHQRGTTSLTIALPFGSMLAPPHLGPWISLMFVAVLSFSFWEPEQRLYMIVFKVSMAQFNLPWLAWVNIGGEAEFGAFDNWHWKHNLTNWIHRRSSSIPSWKSVPIFWGVIN